MSDVDCRFLPWFRRGLSTVIPTSDQDPAAPVRFSTTAITRLANLQGPPETIQTAVTLLGPGDVVGLGSGQVAAREPAHGALAFEPNYFPHIDLFAAELPWRYTPTQAAANGKLRPWLVLVALEQSDTLAVRKSGQAPAAWVDAPIAELPDLAESTLWAHVQIAGPFDATPIAEVVRDQPHRARARLICPRHLQPRTTYLLCLVPAFEIGRLAGLGQAMDEQALGLAPAWTYDPTSTDFVSLPVYEHWTLTTAAAGDFETLARALRPHQIDPNSAYRPFEIDPALSTQPESLGLAGALRPVLDPPPPVETPSAEVTNSLTSWLNRGAEIEDQGGDPQVAPPIYGRTYASARKVAEPGNPAWLDELNLDPRHRLAAAAGGDVVQRHQEEFVDLAWDQAGELRQANTVLRQAQLARAVGAKLQSRHFAPLPNDLMLQIAGPSQPRTKHAVTAQGYRTVHGEVQTSAVPELGFSGAFRRLSRVRGPHMSRYGGGHPVDADTLLFQQGFVEQPMTNWQVVDPNYAVMGPSNWSWSGNGTVLYQTSNIYVPEDAPFESQVSKRGTKYVGGDMLLRDVAFGFRAISQDNDAFGFVFRYQNTSNYYRFSMDSERGYRRLTKFYWGGHSVLWEDTSSYSVGLSYYLQLILDGDHIVIKIGNWTASNTIVDLHDSSLSYGRVGFYTWGNNNTRFDSIHYKPQVGLSGSQLSGKITDEGNISAPSQWITDTGALVQTTNIYTEPQDRDLLPKLGSYLSVGDQSWADYVVEANIDSDDNDTLGLMFRYRDGNNFYRFAMDQERSYMRLVRRVAGQFSLLWQIDEGYATTSAIGHRIRIVADGSRLRGYIGDRRLFDLRDRSHADGGIGFYCWGNTGSRFDNVTVHALRSRGLMERLAGGELGVSIPQGGELDIPALGQTFLTESNSEQTVSTRVFERVALAPEHASQRDALEPVVVGPRLPMPLSLRLIDMAPHLILPGLEAIPDNVVVLLETNPAFVAAFMVGANHEMARELVWRGLPGDPRATVFRQFWDVRGGVYPAGTEAEREAHKDIAPIHDWPTSGDLGTNAGGGQGGSRAIFLIRSEIVRRFPDASYFLVKAEPNGLGGRRPSATTLPYLFRGRLAADMAFFGFDLTAADARGSDSIGDLGWYFTIEQAPTGTRFGLDEGGTPGETLSSWADLAWGHVGPEQNLDADTFNAVPPSGSPLPVWAENGAHMAAITLQKPVRIYVHAKRLLTAQP